MRILTPYEKNFLTKNNFDLLSPALQTATPVEYLVGRAQFRGLNFFVDNSTLIPRLETEQLVDLALENIFKNYSPNQKIIIADICTGSGCIGVSLALELIKKNQDFHLYFSDISKTALAVAQKNFNYFLPDHSHLATFLLSDLFSQFPKNVSLDLVISNPPYIPTKRIKTLDNSVKNYEPLIALDGGDDGLFLINKIIANLPKIQNNKVNALIELDENHTISQIKKSEGLNPSLIKDSFGKNRFLSLLSL